MWPGSHVPHSGQLLNMDTHPATSILVDGQLQTFDVGDAPFPSFPPFSSTDKVGQGWVTRFCELLHSPTPSSHLLDLGPSFSQSPHSSVFMVEGGRESVWVGLRGGVRGGIGCSM